MPIFRLRYRGADLAVIGAIVAALDEILARRTAEAADIHWPGAARPRLGATDADWAPASA
jgi:hypothetical protein